ncbi:tetratricopeptide repeat protein [bacterium]|nr:tetratricopeptide repeat protein [bacterium]
MTVDRERRLLIALLVAAAALRAWFWFELKGTDLAAVPLLDSQTYHEWAARLVAGDWGWHETYWMGPLYPHLLAVVYVIFGVGSQAPLLLQLALSLANVWWLHRFAREALAPDTGDDDAAAPHRAVALLAAALFAFYGAPVFYAGNLLMATLVTSLFLLAARQAVRAVRAPGDRTWFVLGVTVGLTGLARGNVLLLLPALPVLLREATPAPLPRRRVLRLGALALAGGLLVLAPVTLRNLVVADDFVLLTSNGGVNLLIGQQADYGGLFAPVMDEAQAEFDPSMEPTLERELGRDLKGSEVSRILTRRAWDEFRANLGRMPAHYARKIYRFWNGYELPQIVSYDYYRTRFTALRLLPVPYVVLSALGLAGLALLPRRARWVVIVFVGGYFLSLLPFFPTARYRQPIAPLLALSAAAWLWAVATQPAARRRWLPVGLLLVLALWPRWGALDEREVLWQVHLHEASRASKRGDLAATMAAGNRAEEVRPGLADTPYHLALYLEDLGERERAIRLLEEAARRAPANRLIPYRIGRNREEMGAAREAVAAYERAAALDREWSYPWFRGGLVLQREGRLDEARRAMERAYALAPGNQRIRSNLASLCAETGEPDRARELLTGLVRDYPLYVNGWFNLALLEYRQGRNDAARDALDRARGLRGLSADERDRVEELARLLATGSGDAGPP